MAPGGMRIAECRVEGLIDPLGVEERSPRLSWQLESPERGAAQTAYRVQVASTRDGLAAGKADLWDSGRVDSSQSVHVPYAGKPLSSRTQCWWRVQVWDGGGRESAWSEPAVWEMGLLESADWKAQWIGRAGRTLNNWSAPVLPAPLLRKAFTIGAGVRRARIYVAAPGYHVLRLNGQRVGDHVLDPGVTHFDRRVRYVVHDVTGLLKVGENAIGAMLGNGWYNTHTQEVWHFDKASWRDYPKLLLQLEIEREDGSREVIASDHTWRVAEGPIVFDQLRNGEHYDARREKPGWDAAGFDDAAWERAAVVAGPGGRLESQQMPPCRVTETIAPVSVKEVKPGVAVYDLGQNIAGWVQIRVDAPAGTEIVLRYAERLKDDGDITQDKIDTFIKSGECQTDRYICKGTGEEVWEPGFTYHGFQYVQVTGLPGTPALDRVRGRVVQTAFRTAGEFTCSNELLNRLQTATLWSYRGNFVGIPTDCPHREKNGWTGDAQLACETGMLNFDATAAYRQWLRSFPDTQRPSGQLPGIVPSTGWGFNWGNGPAWDSALLLIPYTVYLYTGDTRSIEENYDAMRRYVDYCSTMAVDGLANWGLGDWCHVDRKRAVPAKLTSTGYWYVDCRVFATFAELLNRRDEAARYRERAERIRAAFQKRYYKGEGQYANGEQTALGCALYQEFADTSDRPAIARNLRAALEANGGKLDFGILGAKYVPRALADEGHADAAYAMFTRTDFPSWGWWLEQGATTLWEDWNGGSSRNHIMYGDISAWMYNHLAGIAPDPTAPGFRRVLVRPNPVGDLTAASAWHRSPYGVIRSAWKRENGRFILDLEIPANATARVTLPVPAGAKVTEGGVPVENAAGVVAASPDGSRLDIRSGKYRFIVA